jgi:hypothetical protein
MKTYFDSKTYLLVEKLKQGFENSILPESLQSHPGELGA